MRSPVRQWRSLSNVERRLLLGLAIGLPLVSVALRVFGYGRTRAWLDRRTSHASPGPASPEALANGERIARLAAIAGRLSPGNTSCLRQSLLVYTLLRRRGLLPQLKIGVGKADKSIDMHAWVELEGHALGQSQLRHRAFE